MKEAGLYEKLENAQVACFLCSHRCRIAPGRRGFCGVRVNKDGRLYVLTYGRVIARQVDPIEKKPLFHFMPGTKSYSIAAAGCNFRCGFCQNWTISQLKEGVPDQLAGEEMSPDEIVREALRNNCQSISYTYTEPTIFFEFACAVASLAKEKGLKNNFVTNGYQTRETIAKMAGLIDAANIDLKSFSEEFYRELCQARLGPVLEAIRAMYQKGILIEITTLIVPHQNDSENEIRKIAEFIFSVSPDIPWHISRYQPAYRMNDGCPTPIDTLTMARQTGYEAGLHYCYIGNVSEPGFEDTICPNCQEVVIGRAGFSISKQGLKNNCCGRCGKELPLVV